MHASTCNTQCHHSADIQATGHHTSGPYLNFEITLYYNTVRCHASRVQFLKPQKTYLTFIIQQVQRSTLPLTQRDYSNNINS